MTRLISSPSELANFLGKAQGHGDRWQCLCPAHDDSNASLSVSRGDKIDIVTYCHAGCSFEKIAAALKDRGVHTGEIKKPVSNRPQGVPYAWPTAAMLKKNGLTPSPENQGTFVKNWPYYDETGSVVGHAVRYEKQNGDKSVIPFFCQGLLGWKSGHALKEGRVLYGLNTLLSVKPEVVIVVEGEKCAESINELKLTGVSAVTWAGGASTSKKTNWAPLAKIPTVILWPDFDSAGVSAMKQVHEILSESNPIRDIFWLDPRKLLSGEVPEKGYDCFDYIKAVGKDEFRKLYMSGLIEGQLEEPTFKQKDPIVEVVDSLIEEVKSEEPKFDKKPKVHYQYLPNLGGYPMSEDGMAEMLYHSFGENLKYTSGRGWMAWDGKRWGADQLSKARRFLSSLAEKIASFSKEVDNKEASKIRNFALSMQNQHKMDACLELLTDREGVRTNALDFNNIEHLFNSNNCIIDLRSGKAIEHDRKYLMSCISPVDYKPEAKCPRWEQFLYDIFEQESHEQTVELVSYVQRALGYTMSGNCSEQVMFFMYGAQGGNGKTTFVSIIEKVFGPYAQATKSELILRKKHDSTSDGLLAVLSDCRFVHASETPQDVVLDEATVKTITGQDKLNGRYLYHDPFTYTCRWKPWFRSNHKPIIKGTDNAIWRRIHCIPFLKSFLKDNPKTDLKLSDKLELELEGILAWIVRGAVAWYEFYDSGKTGLEMPACVKAATAEYRKEMDTMGEFLEECCVLESGAEVKSGVLYNAYCNWTRENGHRFPRSSSSFGQSLLSRGGISSSRSHGSRKYIGVTLRAGVNYEPDKNNVIKFGTDDF